MHALERQILLELHQRERHLPQPSRHQVRWYRQLLELDLQLGIKWDSGWIGAETDAQKAKALRHLSNLELDGYVVRAAEFEGWRRDRVKLTAAGQQWCAANTQEASP